MNLNEAQQRAVTQSDGPSLVLAGAGSGKTRVIVERLSYLIGERGVDPRRILALTFTNKAASEMRDRVAKRLGRDRIGAWLGTFHSFGLYLLRREIDALGRSKSFSVFDDADQLSLMKRLIKDLPKGLTSVSPREALSWISRLKQSLEKPGDDQSAPEEETYRHLWNRYHNALANASAVDFDDLLVLPVRLLEEHDTIRDRYQHRYQYVHIDEYQDTNRAQYVLARRLTETHKNLFVVGDEDQSIYSWRGATIRNILDFESDFPDAQVFRLEQNYRSTAPILSAANALVAHNVERLGKTLWTEEKAGDPVRCYEATNDEDEARFVAEEIAEHKLPDTAVLFRTNGQSRLIEEALRLRKVPYVVVGGIKFYERKEIKDLIAYLRLLVNPKDEISLRRIINVPSRGLGATTLSRFDEYMAERGEDLKSVLRVVEHDQTFSARARESVAQFIQIVDDLSLAAQRDKVVGPVVVDLLNRTGYRDYVERSDEKDARARVEIVDEFVSSCMSYDERGGKGLENFLQDLALQADIDAWDSDMPAVTLMTCHSAKGLEFDEVYLIGLEEGLLPHASAQDSDEEIEEERRLCYVAMTRARKRLTLTLARRRMMYGEVTRRDTSRFLDEIPKGQLEVVEAETAPPRTATASPKRTSKPAPPRGEVQAIKMGTRVRHAKFGKGIVMYTSGSGKKLKARIRFETGRTREFMINLAPIEILEGRNR